MVLGTSLPPDPQAEACRYKVSASATPSSQVSANHVVFNANCVTDSEFGAYVAGAWSHEAQHLDGARQGAAMSINQLPNLIEPLVGTSQTNFEALVQDLYNSAKIGIIYVALDVVHSVQALHCHYIYVYNTPTVNFAKERQCINY